jgi:hypothetical protein
VHGAVGLPSLYLDGAAVQFITFEDAVLRGEGGPDGGGPTLGMTC